MAQTLPLGTCTFIYKMSQIDFLDILKLGSYEWFSCCGNWYGDGVALQTVCAHVNILYWFITKKSWLPNTAGQCNGTSLSLIDTTVTSNAYTVRRELLRHLEALINNTVRWYESYITLKIHFKCSRYNESADNDLDK